MPALIAEILPEAYDVEGRKVFRPDSRRHSAFKPTFPIGKFLSQPLQIVCADLMELRKFLAGCKYVSDREQFGKDDYWQSPEDFEKSRKGDCEDFALWTWRQLVYMNYEARFVVGKASRYGEGHSWVTFEEGGKHFLLEPLRWSLGLRQPRLSILWYDPMFSVAWDGKTVSYYQHEPKEFHGSLAQIATLVWEWLWFWSSFWIKFLPKLVRRLARLLFTRLFGKATERSESQRTP